MLDTLTDVTYEIDAGLAWITINRPDRFNSFRAHTVDELIACFKHAWASPDVGVVALTGAGERAFSSGGDQKQRAETGDYGPSATGLFEVDTLHRTIREIPKPVIAAVNGFAIGGGHVLHVLCDLTIAADSAVFGQVGPKVGSFDAGWGTSLLARSVGDKRAREIWFLNERYTAQQALEMGLVNKVVPMADLDAAVTDWTDKLAERSPTALAFLKRSFNADSDSIRGISNFALHAVKLFYDTPESKEGVAAFNEKRTPDFHKFVS